VVKAPPRRRGVPVGLVVAGLALAAATFAAYAGALDDGFVDYDDPLYVTDNPHVLAGLGAGGLRWAFATLRTGNWHPLTWLSLQLDATLFGLAAPGFHLTNVLLHVANAVLLFAALRRLTGALWCSLAVAALFALHPLHVESVAWVSERKDVLSTFFGLLALLAYAAYARDPRPRRYLPVALAFALSLLAKPMLVTLPFVLLLLDYWPLGRFGTQASPARGRGLWRLVSEKLPLLALSAASCAVTLYAQRAGGAVAGLADVPLGVRVATALQAYAGYLAQAAWPARLAACYPLPAGDISPGPTLLAAAVVAALTAVAVAARRRPYLLVGWLWYLGTLVPVIGLVQVGLQARADRYTYFPLIGVFLAAVWGAADLARGRRGGIAALAAAAAAVLLACGLATRQQVRRWHDPVTLWEHAAAVTEGNWVALTALGGALLDEGRANAAAAACEQALRIRPGNGRAENNLGAARLQQGDYEAAASWFRAAARDDPTLAEAYANLGRTLLLRGRPAEAVEPFRRAGRLRGDSARIRSGLAFALHKAGRADEAAAEYRAADALDPNWAYAVGREAWGLATDPDPGRRCGPLALQMARQVDRGTGGTEPLFLNVLGAAEAECGHFAEAAAAARRAVALLPPTAPAELKRAYGERVRLYEAKQPYRAPPRPAP
jgi:Flp pilus assembly protein TadD